MMGEEAALQRDDPVATLVEKFKAWVQVQPEWLVLVQLDRPARRAGMKELASRLYTIATLDAANTVPRVVRRKAQKQLSAVANDLARKQVMESIKSQEQLLLQAALEIGRQQAEDLSMEKQAVAQQVQEMLESGEISPEAIAAAQADAALMAEAEASVALDGETQVVDDQGIEEEIAFIESDETAPQQPALD